jgi:hypothetical protein
MSYFVRITPTSARRQRLSGALYAFDLSREQLIERIVDPYERGEPITLNGRTLQADDITSVEITEIGPDGVGATPLAQLRHLWTSGNRRQVGSWIANNAEPVSDEFITRRPAQSAASLGKAPRDIAGAASDGDESPSSGAPPGTHATPPASGRPAGDATPRWLMAFIGALAVVTGLVTLTSAPAAAKGAAISAVLAITILHRHVWRWPPVRWAGAVVLTLALAGGVIGHALAARRSGSRSNEGAAQRNTATTVPGTGQVAGGNVNYRVSNTTRGTPFANHIDARPCDELVHRLHVYNPGPGDLTKVRVAMGLNAITPYRKWVSTAVVHTRDGLTDQVGYEATVRISAARTQSYVRGSTALENSVGRVIATSAAGRLSDAITATANGIDIGPLGHGVSEYVLMRSRVDCSPPKYK